MDVFERVLMKGAVVENLGDAGTQDAGDDSVAAESASLRVSIAGVDLINVQTELSWRSLDEPEERQAATE